MMPRLVKILTSSPVPAQDMSAVAITRLKSDNQGIVLAGYSVFDGLRALGLLA